MKRLSILCGAALSSVFLSGVPASAAPNGYRVEMTPLVLLAGGGETLGVDRTVVPGDLIMTTGIGIADAAHLESSVTLTLAGLPQSFGAGDLLIGATLAGQTVGGAVYCDAPHRPEKPQRDETQPGLGSVSLRRSSFACSMPTGTAHSKKRSWSGRAGRRSARWSIFRPRAIAR